MKNKQGELLFPVEALRSRRVGDDGVEFLVKWKDFPESDNTWESRDTLIEDGLAALVNVYECPTPPSSDVEDSDEAEARPPPTY